MAYESLPAEVAAGLDAARPVIARNAADGAAARRIPEESLDALTEAGVFLVMVPKRHGYEGCAKRDRLASPGQAVRRRDRPGGRRYGAVRITGPSSVMAMVCSLWAARVPSAVRMVHPSSSR